MHLINCKVRTYYANNSNNNNKSFPPIWEHTWLVIIYYTMLPACLKYPRTDPLLNM